MAIIIDKGALCICVRKSSNVILLTKEMKKGVFCIERGCLIVVSFCF